MRQFFFICYFMSLLAGASSGLAQTDDPARVLAEGSTSPDGRLGKLRTLNDKDFFFTPPATREAWQQRALQIRQRLQVALGLWPMPPKTPLQPVIHGRIDRDGYSIEKVYFASLPGHYVTGNLYRPTSPAPSSGKRPAVLSPHGHWRDGRFYQATEAEIQRQLASKAESYADAARSPLQARCAQLARMGFVVFHYDMVGYADSKAIAHTEGFTDAQAELRLQNFMGLQTWNSIRALDFLAALPDVDPQRIAVTGSSGGGTQTFILCAIDDRPIAAFPAVMVSTAMQGGCICENCSYLRIGTNNVEFAALFAPKPQAFSCANDWTLEFDKKGFPELKQLYTLLGAADQVAARVWPEFGHNYNQPAREFMYDWFDRKVLNGLGGIREKPYQPVPVAELSVFNAQHPVPKDATNAAGVRKYWTETSDRQLAALKPHNAESAQTFQQTLVPALAVMLGDSLPPPGEVQSLQAIRERRIDDGKLLQAVLGRKGASDAVPAVAWVPTAWNGTVVLWVHPDGKRSLFREGKPSEDAKSLLQSGAAILAIDALRTGENGGGTAMKVDARFAGYTYGYNRPLLAERVRDILTAVAFARDGLAAKTIHLLGWEKAGPWVVLARTQCGSIVSRTAADLSGFQFQSIATTDDPMMLPGAVKYGDIDAMVALCAPHALLVHDAKSVPRDGFAVATYQALNKTEALQRSEPKLSAKQVVDWLLRGTR